MKCLTIHQPWASLIAQGRKSIENRGWTTSYRGPILIHAGRSRKSLDAGRRYAATLGIGIPPESDLPFGAIVAVARLVRCAEFSEIAGQPFAEGPYCWMLDNIRAVEPFPWTGGQGLFNVPTEIVRQLRSPDESRLIEIESSLPDWTPGVLPLH